MFRAEHSAASHQRRTAVPLISTTSFDGPAVSVRKNMLRVFVQIVAVAHVLDLFEIRASSLKSSRFCNRRDTRLLPRPRTVGRLILYLLLAMMQGFTHIRCRYDLHENRAHSHLVNFGLALPSSASRADVCTKLCKRLHDLPVGYWGLWLTWGV